jgi:DNA-binding NarL/FixJ family response regulator
MPKSVLIVDDNSSIREALCRLFTSADFTVCAQARNGREAIQKAQQLVPDLIVIDFSMPEVNGLQAAGALKKLLPTIPLILFSEFSRVLSGQEVETAGFSAVVSKSEHLDVLLEKARALAYPAAA